MRADPDQRADASAPSGDVEAQTPAYVEALSAQLRRRRKDEFRQRMLGPNRRAINYQSRILALSMIAFVIPAYLLAAHFKIGLYRDIVLNIALFGLAFWFSAWCRRRAYPPRR